MGLRTSSESFTWSDFVASSATSAWPWCTNGAKFYFIASFSFGSFKSVL